MALVLLRTPLISAHYDTITCTKLVNTLVFSRYVFMLTDFDNDGSLGRQDLHRTINCLTRKELRVDEIEFICDKVTWPLQLIFTKH